MTAWNAAPMNWRKLTVEPHKQMRRCHNPHFHGPLLPMDGEARPLWFHLIFIASAIYGVAIWL